nr:MAG TPA: hypothetical protein [Herelleviridae sp.]
MTRSSGSGNGGGDSFTGKKENIRGGRTRN